MYFLANNIFFGLWINFISQEISSFANYEFNNKKNKNRTLKYQKNADPEIRNRALRKATFSQEQNRIRRRIIHWLTGKHNAIGKRHFPVEKWHSLHGIFWGWLTTWPWNHSLPQRIKVRRRVQKRHEKRYRWLLLQ